MGRMIAVVVLASMVAGGCAPALSRVHVGWGAGGVQLTTRTEAVRTAAARKAQSSPHDPSPSAQEASPAALRVAAARIPVGAKVKVTMRSGPELKGTLREVGTTGIVLQKPAAKDAGKAAAGSGSNSQATATAETVGVSYEAMRSIERDASMGTAKKAALIAALAAAAGIAIYQVQKGPAADTSVPAGG